MGHRDLKTTLIYRLCPGAHEVDLVAGAFADSNADTTRRASTNPSTKLSGSQAHSDQLEPAATRRTG